MMCQVGCVTSFTLTLVVPHCIIVCYKQLCLLFLHLLVLNRNIRARNRNAMLLLLLKLVDLEENGMFSVYA